MYNIEHVNVGDDNKKLGRVLLVWNCKSKISCIVAFDRVCDCGYVAIARF